MNEELDQLLKNLKLRRILDINKRRIAMGYQPVQHGVLNFEFPIVYPFGRSESQTRLLSVGLKGTRNLRKAGPRL